MPAPRDKPAQPPRILRDSARITVVNVCAALVGFLTNAVLAASFGAGADMDALFVAQTLPLLIQAVFATAANYAVIPALGDLDHGGRRADSACTVATLLVFFSLCLAGITLGTMLASHQLVALIAPGLPEHTQQMAASLLRVQAPVILAASLGALASSIHSARKNYYHGPLANLLGALILLGCILSLRTRFGIACAAIGAVASALVVLAVLLVPQLRRDPFRPILRFWQDPAMRTILCLMLPLLLGAVFYRADALIQRFVASSLPSGSISHLGYGQKVMMLVAMVICSGMPVVALSHFSESLRQNDKAGLAATFVSVFRWMAFVCAGTIAGLAVCGAEIVEILFLRGKFDMAAVLATDRCLMLYSGVLLAGVMGSIITPVFYAHKDVVTVVLLGVGGTLLQVALSLVLTPWLSTPGLPLAYSISNLAAVGAMFVVLRWKHLPFTVVPVMRFVIVCLLAGGASAVVARLVWPGAMAVSGVWLRLFVKGAVVMVAYLLLAGVLGILHVLAREHPRLRSVAPPKLLGLA